MPKIVNIWFENVICFHKIYACLFSVDKKQQSCECQFLRKQSQNDLQLLSKVMTWGWINHSNYSWVHLYIYIYCNEKRGRNSFTPTMLLAPTFRVTRIRNSHRLLLTQCLLSAFRITPPASPIWSFYSLFSSYANYRYSHIRSPQTHIPLFFFSRRSNADAMCGNLFHYFLYHTHIYIYIYIYIITVK